MARSSTLTPYRRKPVNKTTIKVTGAGDGLSKAMEVDPAEYEPGTTIYVLHKCKVGPHTHELDEDLNEYTLVQTLKAKTATVVDPDFASELIEKQEALIEEHAGIQQLPWSQPADNADELVAQHEAGEHELGLRDGCPTCIAERIDAEKPRRGRKRV